MTNPNKPKASPEASPDENVNSQTPALKSNIDDEVTNELLRSSEKDELQDESASAVDTQEEGTIDKAKLKLVHVGEADKIVRDAIANARRLNNGELGDKLKLDKNHQRVAQSLPEIKYKLNSRVNDIEDYWIQESGKLVEKIQEKQGTLEELINLRKYCEEELEKNVETIAFLIEDISNGSYITEEILLEMEKRFDELEDIMTSQANGELRETLDWAIGNVKEGAKDSPELKSKNFTKLSNNLQNPNSEKAELSWFILSNLSYNQKMDFINFHFKRSAQTNAERLAFLDSGIKEGVIHPGMAEIIGEKYGVSMSQDKIKSYEQTYEMVWNTKKQAKKVFKTVYLGKNAAGEMITGKNAVKFAVQAAATATLVGNVLVAFMAKNPESIGTNPYVYASTGVLVATSQPSLSQFFEPKESREHNRKNQLLNDLLHLDLDSSFARSNGFFASNKTPNLHSFSEFVIDIKQKNDGKIVDKEITKDKFLSFLKEKPAYSRLIPSLESASFDDKKLKNFAHIFEEFNIYGSNPNLTRETYNKYLDQAKEQNN